MDTQKDKQDFLRLIQDNKGIIFKICNSYCANKNDRDDLAQEIIYHLWRSGHRFDASYKFSTWMYRVALNVAISYYRKEKTAKAILSSTDNFIDVEDKNEPAQQQEENIRKLEGFIQQLKELDKALMLLYLEEKSYKEIAEIMGLTETNVATKISRIKEKLKQNFQR